MPEQPSDDSCEKPRVYSFEEFRLVFESTETIVDRKISMTRSNTSLCLAIIAGQSVGASWVYGKASIEGLIFVLLSFISGLGIAFCRYWMGTLDSYRKLNGAKFKLLDEMSQKVAFPDYQFDNIKSVNPSTREWELMEEKDGLVNDGTVKILRGSANEAFVPVAFFLFFLVTGVCLLGFGVLAFIR